MNSESDPTPSGNPVAVPPRPPGGRAFRIAAKVCGVILAALILLLIHAWSCAAIYFSNLPWSALRVATSIAYGAGVVLLIALRRPRRLSAPLTLIPFAVVLIWWLTITPRKDLSYPPETARMARTDFDGDRITVHDIRNFDYRTPEDFDPRWDTREYDLNRLSSVDIFFVYWGVKDVAHTITSFGFENGDHLALSIETRREVGEPNKLLRGIFKQFELAYIWSDERDVIRLRSNYRKEDVYCYRTSLTPALGRQLMIDMLKESNSLHEHPKFYNTVTDNCTNGILYHLDRVTGHPVPIWKRPVRSGLFERRGYDKGFLDTSVSYEDLRRASHINQRAMAADARPDFSAAIREGLPGAK